MNDVYLALGSNLGDRKGNLEKALTYLDGLVGERLRESSVMETEAVGFKGAPFLNMVAAYRTALTPRELLAACKKVEAQLGRKPGEAEYDASGRRIYHDRPIDVDILLFGDMHIMEEGLVIPHPGLRDRAFFREPLNEIYEKD